MSKQQQVGRLALRVEGVWWNAYYAQQGTMEGAILLGSLRMSLARVPKLKTLFMDLMTATVGEAVKETFGLQPTWNAPEAAPEHERSGAA